MSKLILSEYVEPELTAVWEFIAIDKLDIGKRETQAKKALESLLA